MVDNEEPRVSLAQAAKMLGMSYKGVVAAHAQGRLIARRETPDYLRASYSVSLAEIERFRAHREVNKTPKVWTRDPQATAEANAEGLLTVSQAAKMLGKSRQQIEHYAASGRFPVVQRHIRFIPRSYVQKLLDDEAFVHLSE